MSLPFSDHCQPLASAAETTTILNDLRNRSKRAGEKYIEIRPTAELPFLSSQTGFATSNSFSFQQIDLRVDLKTIYSGFHDSCIRRKIKRAEREQLNYESGRSPELLKKFRHLLLLTRRRHKLPPQPAEWFENIVACLGNMVTIHVASKNLIPVASIVTLSYKNTLVYKYGCSDGQFSNMGGTPMLFWKAIQQAKDAGVERFDLGRSDHKDAGLIDFKEHLGAVSSELVYYRDSKPANKKETSKHVSAASSWAREALVRLPDSVLAGVGQVVYRHIG